MTYFVSTAVFNVKKSSLQRGSKSSQLRDCSWGISGIFALSLISSLQAVDALHSQGAVVFMAAVALLCLQWAICLRGYMDSVSEM